MDTRDTSPLPLRVRLPFTSEEEFIRRFGSNLSPSGIFIPTKALKPEGTQLRFELVLTDGTRLLRGGVVVLHALEAAPGQRGGMELAFTELDGPSHALLERVLLAREVRPGSTLVSVGHLLTGRMQTPAEPVPATVPVDTGSGEGAGLAPSPASAPAVHEAIERADREAIAHAEPEDGQHGEHEPSERSDHDASARSDHHQGRERDNHETSEREAFERESTARSGHADQGPAAHQGHRQPPPLPDARASDLAPAPAPHSDRTPASELQRSSRAARIEGLARASAEGIGELVARARQQEAVMVIAFCFDHLDAGVGRIDGGRFQQIVPSHAPQRSSVLRLLARQDGSPRVLELASSLGLQPGDGADGFADWDDGDGRLDGTTRAAHWLESLLAGADALSVGELRRPVLAVPLHAGHLQRQLWHDAATRVGLDNLMLVSTPVAAAIAYAHGRGFARRRLLMLSLSEVGFDAAVVQITGDDVETLSAAGDPFLGTAEFDARMAFLIRQRLRLTGLLPPEPISPEGRLLNAACSNARRELADDDQTTFQITAFEDGAPVPFTVETTRAEIDGQIHDLVERIAELVREVLGGANLSAAGVDEVLVLGQTAHSPLLRRRLSELLERAVGDADEQPSSLVTRGAALFGEAQLRTEQGRPHLQASEVLTVPLAIVERTGQLRRVLDRGTRLPVSKTLSLPGEPGVLQALIVHQGGPDRADADFLGAATCTPSMPGELEVRFRVARDGRVAVELLPPGGGRIELDRASLTAEQLEGLIAHAPEGSPTAPDGGGLFGGLRRLFRKA